MSRHERFGERDLTFSRWHRTLPDRCTVIDVDFLEYCQRCRAPLALIELARDVGQPYKPTTVLQRLAKAANVRAYLILYRLDDQAEHGIADCRVSRVHPDKTELRRVALDKVGCLITRLHDEHACAGRKAA